MQGTDGLIGQPLPQHGKKIFKDDKIEEENNYKMNPEDQTFKVLSRCSFEEILRLFKDWHEPVNAFDDIRQFFIRHKWTYEEYLQEMIKKDGLY